MLEEEDEREQGRKRRKEISYTLQLRSTCTFCSCLVWFPIRRHQGFSATDFSLELAFSLLSQQSHLLHIISTTHGSSATHPQAHTAKGETNREESQRLRVILQVIFPSHGALPWTPHLQIRIQLRACITPQLLVWSTEHAMLWPYSSLSHLISQDSSQLFFSFSSTHALPVTSSLSAPTPCQVSHYIFLDAPVVTDLTILWITLVVWAGPVSSAYTVPILS